MIVDNTTSGMGEKMMANTSPRSGNCCFFAILAALAAGTFAAQAVGQTAAQQATSASGQGTSASGAEGPQLAEIVVTAQRRKEDIQQVPISINALTQTQLAAAGIKNISDLAAVTPGLQFSTPVAPSTITTVNIRGVDANTGPATVAIYLDDTPLATRLSPLGDIGGPLPLISDLNRVEVERGPQGTLFGAGAEGGAVRFIANDPSLTDYSGDAEGQWSDTKYGAPSYEYGGAAGGPIVDDTLGFRASAWYRRDGGYVNLVDPLPTPGPDNAVTASDINRDYEEAFRLALAYQVDGVKITPAVYYQSVDKDDSGRFYPAYSDVSAGEYNDAAFLPEHQIDRWMLPTLKIETGLPFADMTFVSSYLHRDITVTNDFGDCFVCFNNGTPGSPYTNGNSYGSPLPSPPAGADVPISVDDAAPSVEGQRNEAYTQELRFASNHPDAFVTWVGGVFYDVRKQEDYQDTTQLAIAPAGVPVFTVDQHYKDTQTAVFAQADFHLTSQWTATFGYRVARIDTDFTAALGGTANVGPPGNPLTVQTATTSNTATTPKGLLSYHLDPNNLLYVSAAKGFRPGGGNANLPQGCNGAGYHEGYDPDSVWSYEIGAKDGLFDNRLVIDSSVYHILWTHIQSLVQASCGITYTENTGAAAVNGFDVSVTALLTQQLLLSVKAAYTNAYYTETTYNGTTIAVQDGDKIGFLPQVMAPWNVDVVAEYKVPLANGNAVRARIEDQFNSHNPGPFSNGIVGGSNYVPLDVADPATNVINARVAYVLGGLEMEVFANNVFNNQTELARLSYFNGSSIDRIQQSTFRPRTVGVGLNYAF
jgi:iron complex outermembrane recepter protein